MTISPAARRSPFEWLYRLTGLLACLSMVAIALIILADVALRQFGGQLRGADDFAVYALCATGLLGLAPTYRRGEHIRVGLLIDRITGRTRHLVEIVVLVLAVLAVGWGTWWAGHFVYDSWRFNELGQGLVPVKLWIPQLSMVIGLGVFLLALVEDLVRAVTGGTPSYITAASGETELPMFER
jgi:TRAP-type C4-dicarboxylate transport system permease small subunit